MLRRSTITVVAALVAVGIAPAASFAAAGEPRVPTAWAILADYQSRMNELAERVTALPIAGLGGIVADPTSRELRVHWKGTPPAPLSALAASAPADIPIRIVPSPYTEAELLAAAARISAVKGVSAAGPSPDGGAVLVSFRGFGSTRVHSAITAFGVPVRVTEGAAAEPLSRQDDSAPYWGGARFRVGAKSCSTGFGVVHDGAARMLTAGHCGANLDVAYDGGGAQAAHRMGVVTGDRDSRDTMLIRAVSGGNIYRGAWNSVTSTGVAAAKTSFAGNLVCTSGASSGEHCSVKVSAIKQTFTGTGHPVYPTVAAYQTQGGCAAANGDSGGPVFSVRSDGLVDARGTVVGGVVDGTPCPGVVASGASRVWFVDITDSLAFYGATIIAG